MKSQPDIIPTSKSQPHRQDGRNISSAKLRKIQAQKKKKAQKKRRLQVAFLIVHFLLLIGAILWIGPFLLDTLRPIPVKNENQRKEETQYEIAPPQALEYNEVTDKLKNLMERYPEFTDIYENIDTYPEELLAALANNPEMIEFVKGYPSSDGSVTGGLTDAELSEDIPLLIQWDTRWGYASYGDYNIALSGCAPTCLSMVAVGLTGDSSATPDAVAAFAMSGGYHQSGAGTMWSLMTDGCLSFGIQGRELSLSKNIVIGELEAGHPVICSVRPGDFTTTGHFIVLIGVQDGKIQINDPNSPERSGRLWDYETLEGQIKNLWVFQS